MKPITLKRLNEVIQSGQHIGFCTRCGEAIHGVPPLAVEFGCKHCGRFKVFGAKYLRKMQWYSVT